MNTGYVNAAKAEPLSHWKTAVSGHAACQVLPGPPTCRPATAGQAQQQDTPLVQRPRCHAGTCSQGHHGSAACACVCLCCGHQLSLGHHCRKCVAHHGPQDDGPGPGVHQHQQGPHHARAAAGASRVVQLRAQVVALAAVPVVAQQVGRVRWMAPCDVYTMAICSCACIQMAWHYLGSCWLVHLMLLQAFRMEQHTRGKHMMLRLLWWREQSR
jgi:hypothetical protein